MEKFKQIDNVVYLHKKESWFPVEVLWMFTAIFLIGIFKMLWVW